MCCVMDNAEYPKHERFQKMLNSLLSRTLGLSNDIRARDVPVLTISEQYQNYINPIELLRLGEEDLDNLGAKEIQRAKRRLLQEIELEDGVISWMGGVRTGSLRGR